MCLRCACVSSFMAVFVCSYMCGCVCKPVCIEGWGQYRQQLLCLIFQSKVSRWAQSSPLCLVWQARFLQRSCFHALGLQTGWHACTAFTGFWGCKLLSSWLRDLTPTKPSPQPCFVLYYFLFCIISDNLWRRLETNLLHFDISIKATASWWL